jgi:hypothetical protein
MNKKSYSTSLPGFLIKRYDDFLHQNFDFAKDDEPCLPASFPPARWCNGTNVARSIADVVDAVLSSSCAAAAFSSLHRDKG